jgi:hypothetical protein
MPVSQDAKYVAERYAPNPRTAARTAPPESTVWAGFPPEPGGGVQATRIQEPWHMQEGLGTTPDGTQAAFDRDPVSIYPGNPRTESRSIKSIASSVL